MSPLTYLERLVWYWLDLAMPMPDLPLAHGLTLGRAAERDLEMLDQLDTVRGREARRRFHDGAALWMVRDGDRAAFSCWILRGRMPAPAARSGWVDLPAGTVGLEDSVTSPAYRGRAIAPAAWAGVAKSLMRTTARAILTKVEDANIAGRRALEKTGFRPVAFMCHRRIGDRSHVALHSHEGTPAAFLASQFAR